MSTYSQILIVISGFIISLILIFGPILLFIAFRKREHDRLKSYDPVTEEAEFGDACPLGLKDPVTETYYDVLTCNNSSCDHYDILSGCQWHNRKDLRKPAFDEAALDQIFKKERTRRFYKRVTLYLLIGFLVLVSLLVIYPGLMG